jgi:hypothetical protein
MRARTGDVELQDTVGIPIAASIQAQRAGRDPDDPFGEALPRYEEVRTYEEATATKSN